MAERRSREYSSERGGAPHPDPARAGERESEIRRAGTHAGEAGGEREEHREGPEALPRAVVVKNRKTWFFWLVPIGAGLLAAWFIYSNMFRGGPTLHIFFDNAAGLQAGKSQLKYRGAQIGYVKEVKLTQDNHKVEVLVAVDGSAAQVAKAQSQFWIVKPQVGIEQISGLRTIVSGDYVTVQPGGGKEQTQFQGLPDAPILEPPGVLKIEVLAERATSLRKRSPVFYRGMQVGEVYDLALGADSQAIHLKVHIYRHFVPLVRANSKFWNAGGINMNIGFHGLDISAESAGTLLSGGMEFATPDTSERVAPQGTAFRLFDKPQAEWLAWSPAIRLEGESNAPPETTSLSHQ